MWIINVEDTVHQREKIFHLLIFCDYFEVIFLYKMYVYFFFFQEGWDLDQVEDLVPVFCS